MKRHSGGLRCLLLCAQLFWLGARPVQAGRLEDSDGALTGHIEGGSKPGGLLSGLLSGLGKGGGKGVAAAALTAEHLGEGCPPDERPEQCPGWARAGECLRNPTFMRTFW